MQIKSIYYYLAIAILFVLSCRSENEAPMGPPAATGSESNQQMGALLDSIFRHTDPMDNYSMNGQRASLLAQQVANATDPTTRVSLQINYARELLQAGRTEQAIVEFGQVMDFFQRNNIGIQAQTKVIYELQALAYLRLGEQENCIQQPHPESCIIPISPNAVHQMRRGSETAIQLYERILEVFPEDNQTKWLLNLAYMTLGEYPANVPPQWLIDPDRFKVDAWGMDKFTNKAVDLNVADAGLSGSVSWEDYDNDGLLDLFVTSYGMTDNCKLYRNTGSGYEDVTEAAGLTGLTGGLNVLHADYNNDGYTDILVLRGAWFNKGGAIPNSLLRNNGDGTFTDRTAAMGLLSFHPTQTAAWADYNADGYVDLFIGNETTEVNGEILRHPCELYLNQGGNSFIEVATLAGVNVQKWVKGVSSGDINNDGLADLYISVPGEYNILFVNQGVSPEGIPVFQDQAAAAGVQQPLLSFPAWFWDYNNDGWEDIFVACYDFRNTGAAGATILRDLSGGAFQPEETAKLFRNRGDGTFESVGPTVGLDRTLFAMGSNFGDLNADGFLDFYIGNGSPDLRALIPNRMFVSQEGNSFSEVTMAGFGHLQKGHGIAFADYDNDGDEDVYCVVGGAYEGDIGYNVLFENPMEEANTISFLLEGTDANRSAIGARILLSGDQPDGTNRTIFRTVNSGGSFGASTLRQTIGIGAVSSNLKVQILWPGSSTPEMIETPLVNGEFYKIRQGSGVAEENDLPAFVQ